MHVKDNIVKGVPLTDPLNLSTQKMRHVTERGYNEAFSGRIIIGITKTNNFIY